MRLAVGLFAFSCNRIRTISPNFSHTLPSPDHMDGAVGRSGRTLLVFCFCFLGGSIFASGQGTKDAQAATILNSCINASGGMQAVGGVQDFSASGNIDYFWAGQTVQGTVTLKARGIAQFRLDAVLSAGTRSWEVSNGRGSLLNTNASKTPIPYYNGVNVGILSWRFPDIIAALSDATVTVSYVGLVQSDQGQAHQIHIQHTDSANPDPTLANIKAADYFVDPNTFLLLETVDSTYSITDLTRPYQHSILFSDYRNVSGLMVPFSITEEISGQSTWRVNLNSIRFNIGLTDADFTL